MMHFQAQENNSPRSDFTVDNHTGIRYHKDMENTQISGMEVGKIAVYWINHGYYSDQTFDTIGQAIQYARSKGPSARFDQVLAPEPFSTKQVRMLGSWDAIGGLKVERGAA